MAGLLGGVLGGVDAAWRELVLFAGAGILLGGIDDLAVDAAFWMRLGWRRLRGAPCLAPPLDALPPPDPAHRYAVFVPAWDEAGVIGPMLRLLLARMPAGGAGPKVAVYVGCYPNDPATAGAVRAAAGGDPRVRLVTGARAGPTSKADCLNTLWRALERDDPARATRAVILHDAEDVVPAGELRVVDALLGRHGIVQLPVLPLIDAERPLVGGVVADEFAEHHCKSLAVRAGLGAALPLAGVGCAIRCDVLRALAAGRDPFDADSYTEDYEIGLRAAALGVRACFARYREHPGGPLVAVREYFPATVDAAVRQKARWMTGIALAGWDRTGWARPLALGDHWWRLRDRRAPLATLVLCAAWLAAVLWGAGLAAHRLAGIPAPALPTSAALLLRVNGALLAWRAANRALFTGRAYGAREAWRSLPRLVVGNFIALLATRRALGCYLRLLAGGRPRWDKTRHAFPAEFGGAGPAAGAVATTETAG